MEWLQVMMLMKPGRTFTALTSEDEESGTFTISEQDNGIARGDCENDGD